MSLSAAVIDALVQAGATVEQLAAAVKADMAEAEMRIADKRTKDRERQRRHRSSRDVTVTNCDTPSPLAPPKVSPGPPSNNPPISPNPSQSAEADVSAEPTDKPLTGREVLDAWHERMVPQGFPPVRKMTAQRQRQLKARLRDSSIDEWLQAMSALERSAFCRGENERGWRADFDFLLQPKSFTKLLEGAYDH